MKRITMAQANKAARAADSSIGAILCPAGQGSQGARRSVIYAAAMRRPVKG